jgi:hypothetical protein
MNGNENGVGTILESIEFTINNNFKVTPINSEEVLLSKREVESIGFDNENIDKSKLEIIKKVFDLNDLQEDDIVEGLQVKRIISKSQNAHTITLIAKPGYTINR